MLGAAVAKATGQRLDDYARDRLFTPLDITDYEWVKRPSRRARRLRRPRGLRLRARDTAKLGQLMLSDGAVERTSRSCRRAGPRNRSCRASTARASIFYGYQWWLGRSFRNGAELTWAAGVGYGGQRLFVVPALDLVVMVNAGHYSGPLQGVIPPASSTGSCCRR